MSDSSSPLLSPIAEISEIELDLSSLISNLSLSENNLVRDNSITESRLNSSRLINSSNKSVIMANQEQTPGINRPVFQIKDLDLVPVFDGNSRDLARYIEIADKLVSLFWNPVDLTGISNLRLIEGIYSKLSGQARDVFNSSVSKDWGTIKNLLKRNFGDRRNEAGLMFDLSLLRQNQNESALQFYDRVNNTLSALHNYVDVHVVEKEIRNSKKLFFNEYALTILLAGLREPQGSVIRSMKPTTLSDAQQFIISDNHIRYLQKSQPTSSKNLPPINQNRQPRPFDSSQISQTHFQPQFQHFNQNPQNFMMFRQPSPFLQQNPFSPPPNQFPRGPINIQPINRPPRKLPTNSQVFGTPKNVWKPQNKTSHFPRPTPMSGISYASGATNKPPNNSYFQPVRNSHPYLTFEELHNISGNAPDCDNYYGYEIEGEQQEFDPSPAENGSGQEEYYSQVQEVYEHCEDSNFQEVNRTTETT